MAPSLQTFTWSRLSSSVLLISNLAPVVGGYSTNGAVPAYTTLTSLTVTTGGLGTAQFTVILACNPETPYCDSPANSVGGLLVAGTF